MKSNIKETYELRIKVRNELKRLVEFANAHIFPKISSKRKEKIKCPEINYFSVGKKAGSFDVFNWEISLNEVLLAKYGDDFINDTLPHEFAHACQAQWTATDFFPGANKKRDIHGRNFKMFMRMMGYKPTTYHTYDTAECAKKSRSWRYVSTTDPKVVMILKTKRHNMMQKGLRNYYPTGYKGHTFKFVGEELPVAAQNKQNPTNKPKTSKMEMCRNIKLANPNASRQQLISLFISQAGCTKAGASTYYYSLNK